MDSVDNFDLKDIDVISETSDSASHKLKVKTAKDRLEEFAKFMDRRIMKQ